MECLLNYRITKSDQACTSDTFICCTSLHNRSFSGIVKSGFPLEMWLKRANITYVWLASSIGREYQTQTELEACMVWLQQHVRTMKKPRRKCIAPRRSLNFMRSLTGKWNRFHLHSRFLRIYQSHWPQPLYIDKARLQYLRTHHRHSIHCIHARYASTLSTLLNVHAILCAVDHPFVVTRNRAYLSLICKLFYSGVNSRLLPSSMQRGSRQSLIQPQSVRLRRMHTH